MDEYHLTHVMNEKMSLHPKSIIKLQEIVIPIR